MLRIDLSCFSCKDSISNMRKNFVTFQCDSFLSIGKKNHRITGINPKHLAYFFWNYDLTLWPNLD